MTSESADWRERYLQLAGELESDQARHATAQREFIRLITRLCIAVSGLDPVLDPHIERLRQMVKQAERSGSLPPETHALTETLLHAAEERSRPGVLQRLLQRRGLARDQIDAAVRQWDRLAGDPAAASDAQLDRLVELLQLGPSAPAASAARPGLLARLVGARTPGDRANANRLLFDMLAAVTWPTSLRTEVDAFRSQLQADDRADAWVGVVRQISDLVVRATDQAQDHAKSAETFLTELNQRLEEFDAHMLGETQRREDSRVSGERLGQHMHNEVDSLSARVRDSVDLGQLQSSVVGSLERIHAHVRSHLDEENTRRENAEAEAVALRRQLRRLEQDTFDLRRQVAQTHAEAQHDPLTGLPNRRAYDDRVQQEFARWRRFAEPLALVVWDVDDFKAINDRFGHKAGDRALAMIAKILRARLRETDFVARYGGEEFVTLLTGAGSADALRVADATRAAVEEGGLHANGQPVRITLSGGLAMFRQGDTAEAAFERADQAMYRAKREGKNRVIGGD